MSSNTRIIVSRASRSTQSGFWADLGLWCEGKMPWPRIAFLLWAVFVGIEFLHDPGYVSLIYWLDFGIHELGHVLTRPFVSHTVYVASGTITQLGVPIFAVFMFRRQDDLFAAYSFCSIWLATNLYYTAWYIADARAGMIPSAPIFGEPTTSDWAYLLGQAGWLHLDTTFATALEVIAFPLLWGGVLLGSWMTYRMFRF